MCRHMFSMQCRLVMGYMTCSGRIWNVKTNKVIMSNGSNQGRCYKLPAQDKTFMDWWQCNDTLMDGCLLVSGHETFPGDDPGSLN